MGSAILLILHVFTGYLLVNHGIQANAVDDLIYIMNEVNSTNCNRQPVYLNIKYLQQAPSVTNPSFVQNANRTNLQYAFNIAANRAIFLSLIYSWTNNSQEFESQPGLNYLSMSETANVLAGPDSVTSSGIFYLPNRSYPNWLPTISFNQTLPLFAIRASREEGSSVVSLKDLGATPETNYTNSDSYPQNTFIRENLESQYPRLPLSYRLDRQNADGTTSSLQFRTYPLRAQSLAKTYRPVYDCGQTNRYIVPLSAQASEFLPRYSFWQHLRRIRVVASSTVDVLYESIDIDPCPSPQLSRFRTKPFAGIASCAGTDRCIPLSGQGLTDTAYDCCEGPECALYERVTDADSTRGQSLLDQPDRSLCSGATHTQTPTQLPADLWSLPDLKVLFEVQGRTGLRLAHFLSNFLQNNDPQDNVRNPHYLMDLWNREYLAFLESRNNERLPVGGNFPQFEEPEADSPMRYVRVDQALNRKWLEAEVFSTVMADGQIMSAGIYLEPGVFPSTPNPVSAVAWKSSSGSDDNSARVADVFQLGENFATQDFYTNVRTDFYSENSLGPRSVFRSTSEVRTARRHKPPVQSVPGELSYVAIDYDDGHWLTPYFLCNDRLADWSVSFVAPIFAKDANTSDIVFAGAVKVDAYFRESHLFSHHQR